MPFLSFMSCVSSMRSIPGVSCLPKCGVCGQTGHDRRNCPQRANEAPGNQNALPTSAPVANTTAAAQDISTLVSWDSCYYVVFDLETTGFSRTRNEIIQIGAQILDSDGVPVENGLFCSLVKPVGHINDIISNLTGITNAKVHDADNFETVGGNFLKFIRERCVTADVNGGCENDNELSSGENVPEDGDIAEKDIILVAHNGVKFDVPFLFAKYSQNEVNNLHA